LSLVASTKYKLYLTKGIGFAQALRGSIGSTAPPKNGMIGTRMGLDLDALTLTDLIRLQDELSQTIKRRFEKSLALAFSDIVGSTPYFERFGNEAGEGMRRRHTDLVQEAVKQYGGRLVDTAGDGAFTCFPRALNAVEAYKAFQLQISESNASRDREHHLVARVGIHFGQVITDGVTVSGDPVNLCSRVAGTAAPGEIRLTKEAFLDLPPSLRLSCRKTPQVPLKGISRPVDILIIDWRDRSVFPVAVMIEQTQVTVPLPDQDLITVGRLPEVDGVKANDIVLTLPDPRLFQQISRWHFELRRHRAGMTLRSTTDATTEVDGQLVTKGQEVPVHPGTIVVLSRVITLRFIGEARDPNADGGRTLGTA
jgi:class 3 adenylate cyclase